MVSSSANYKSNLSVTLTLNRNISGSNWSSGRPLTFTKPLPLLQCATAVAVFCTITIQPGVYYIITFAGGTKKTPQTFAWRYATE